MTNEETNDQIIETIDEEGNVVKFELIDIVEVDEIEYGLLLPCDETAQEDEENEVVLMRLKKDGDEFVFEAIENDEEFNKVVEYVQSMDDEVEDEEE